jgi:hypothetical protein
VTTQLSRRAQRIARRRAREQAATMPRRRAWRNLLEAVCDGDEYACGYGGLAYLRRVVMIDPTSTPVLVNVGPTVLAGGRP